MIGIAQIEDFLKHVNYGDYRYEHTKIRSN